MIWVELAIVLLFIFIGARIGGIGIGLHWFGRWCWCDRLVINPWRTD